jgi:hypothetical protein
MCKKYNCPIEIKIFPRGAGWTDISWYVPEQMSEPLILTASYIGCNMSDFVRSLYYLYPNQFETGRAGDLVEVVDYEYDMKTKRHGKMYKLGEDRPQGAYTECPIKAEFHFEEEPGGSDWTISREPSVEQKIETDFPVHVNIKLDKYKGGQFSREFDYDGEFNFNFMYSDLCYAVGKAMTDVMKRYGLYGYWCSTSDCIDVVHLIFLKSVALGNTDTCRLTDCGQCEGESSDFSREMELLHLDM